MKLRYQDQWADGEHEIGYAYYNMKTAFDLPIERLMLEVLVLILDAGRSPNEFQFYHKERISDILATNELVQILKYIPDAEKENLLDDIEILKFI